MVSMYKKAIAIFMIIFCLLSNKYIVNAICRPIGHFRNNNNANNNIIKISKELHIYKQSTEDNNYKDRDNINSNVKDDNDEDENDEDNEDNDNDDNNKDLKTILLEITANVATKTASTVASTVAATGVVVTDQLTYIQTMTAGALSRTMAQTLMHPANTYKTLLQLRNSDKTNSILNKLTPERLLRGKHCLYFCCSIILSVI